MIAVSVPSATKFVASDTETAIMDRVRDDHRPTGTPIPRRRWGRRWTRSRTGSRIFPTAVLRHQGVREVLGEMLTRGSVRGAAGVELRGMAYRADLLTEETSA